MTHAAVDDEQRKGAARFTYASGSRPLQGYTIKRGVGRGGFGEVYYATSDGGKEVALKLIRRNLEVELRGVKHCLNLKHPNLVNLFDIHQDDQGDSWVVMEYVRGESLEDAIDRHPNGMPLEDVLRWMEGVAGGVAYLHDHGIVHRDLKPGNIFDDEGLVKIGDYGLSKFISASRRSGQTESVGTVHYMAPEIANGRYGKEIDIYALGVMLYEMLTGRVPFEGESVGEVLMKHLTAEPDLTELAEPYRAVVARALTKDPEKRYRSVGEMMEALSQAGGPAGQSADAVRPPAQPRPDTPVPTPTPGPTPHPKQGVPPQTSPSSEEEPVWRAIRESCGQMHEAWSRANVPAPLKVILVLMAIFLAVAFSGVWVWALMAFGITYAVYFLIRTLVLAISGEPVEHHDAWKHRHGVPQPMPPPGAGPVFHWGQRPRDAAAHMLRSKPPRVRFGELLGSLLLAAAVAVALGVVMNILVSGEIIVEQLAWFSLVGIAGAWGVLIPSKIWEGATGEPIVRRFVLLCMGLALGFWAFTVDQSLSVVLVGSGATERGFSWFDPYSSQFANVIGRPTLEGYLAYFGFLFPVLRWWRLADPLRRVRFSFWHTAVVVIWAGLLSLAWPFPQPWGMMAAASIAISVQLASSWMDEREMLDRRIV